ncbi:MAG TPA: hypothetical protein VMU94_22685 [Streptosporangiaceae bacterium]|nr:hypothetical protein [Streptosporangiaceae bacterium]
MNITPLRVAGVPMHPVSLAARYLPPRSQDTNLRILQRLVFGDLSKLGYPRSQICAPDVVICATGYRPDLDRFVGQQVELDTSGMPPFTGAMSSPVHPGLWFFGLDRSIYGNMHIRRRQARQLARQIVTTSTGAATS